MKILERLREAREPYQASKVREEARAHNAMFEAGATFKKMDDYIARLRIALMKVREENNRAKRQFTNVSNNLIEDSCKILDEPFEE